MEISNGVTVDANWTKVIAHRSAGAAWKTINKSNLSVKSGKVNGNTDSPLVSSGSKFIIEIMYEDEVMLRFNLADVTNQAGWTLNDAGLAQAVTDLNTWISS